MNDVCDVAAQNFVIDLQESINDVLIDKKCFTEKKEERKEEKGEFALHPTMSPCSDEQVCVLSLYRMFPGSRLDWLPFRGPFQC